MDHLDDGEDSETFLRQERCDKAIINVNLPRLSGLALVRRRSAKEDATPVLILTAMGKTLDRVKGLDAGADDYLVKSIEMEELFARLQALAGRQPDVQPAQETLGGIIFDRAARTVSSGGKVLDLPRRQLALFKVVFDHRGRLLDKERITTALYGAGAEVESNAVELLVSRLRPKIEGMGVTILTARGLGYMLDETR